MKAWSFIFLVHVPHPGTGQKLSRNTFRPAGTSTYPLSREMRVILNFTWGVATGHFSLLLDLSWNTTGSWEATTGTSCTGASPASGKQPQGIRDGTSLAPAAGFPSVMKISENNTINNELNSKHVSEEFVNKQINQLNVKKATGHDGISPKILKMTQQEITNPITKLVNKSIDSSIFPADLKAAQASPLYKKK